MMSEETKRKILITAVDRGMTWTDAEQELDAFLKGNTGRYTARIQSIMAFALGNRGPK